MDEIIAERLCLLPHDLQMAYAAVCVERVLPIYVWQCGSSMAVSHAIDDLWLVAGGKMPSELDVVRRVAEIQAVTPRIDTEGGRYGPSISVCVAIAHAMATISDDTGVSAARAGASACEAADLLVAYLTDGTSSEEEQWQKRALHLLEQWGLGKPSRGMFAGLDHDLPAWRMLLAR